MKNTGECVCDDGWDLPDCLLADCNVECVNGGCPGDRDLCVCDDPDMWSGDACDVPVCPDDCNGKGTCTAPGECECSGEYSGDACEVPPPEGFSAAQVQLLGVGGVAFAAMLCIGIVFQRKHAEAERQHALHGGGKAASVASSPSSGGGSKAPISGASAGGPPTRAPPSRPNAPAPPGGAVPNYMAIKL